MPDTSNDRYTVEQLQQEYALSLPRAVELLDRFGGDRSSIEKLLKHCPHRDGKGHH